MVDFVDEGGQLDIADGKTLNVMCCQSDLNTVVDVEPLGVMVVLVSVESDTGHEAKGGVEVLKDEGALDGLTTVDEGPVLELGEGLGLFLGSELLEHFSKNEGSGSDVGKERKDQTQKENETHFLSVGIVTYVFLGCGVECNQLCYSPEQGTEKRGNPCQFKVISGIDK